MPTNIVTFPRTTVANTNARVTSAGRGAMGGLGTIVSIEGWKRRTRTLRTPSGVFFMTSVLTTTGDFA